MSETAIFAGGCFWCMIEPFDTRPGIISIVSGYTGGYKEHPTYEEVCTGLTGHTEAVKIEFDPEIISYDELLQIYWQQTDPTDAFGQFQDRGDSYRPVIFYTNDAQKEAAEASKQALADSGKYLEPIVTQIEPASPFYLAETYHQDFYKKHPMRYKLSHLERERFLKKVWGD
ncbi:peptide-methionine (S)-S-oxide reductase [Vagococcus penaei]|uniref:Peptide methionine sulfoxide reductase MsrA n=1 Tax=Vagococcus penaei TaxID=633807 RepID=A0A1Q2D9L1_9ENTE|nr:peptide-methionine (S)-S-oxide reductase MsrA [Vagococcus penaei]AQP54843.1 peptide-methionine (S)-S-oxide reductase [Vagococcus penaei]RSU05380.1 peptide-methionine (S)-S-oxide reductase [Vagococcus penaei]